LRLFLALIANSEHIAKLISEENNNEALYSILAILKGPNIPNTKFSPKITFFALTIMRALMQSSALPKIFFIDDPQSLDAVLSHLRSSATLSEQTEVCIYSFLTQVIKDEPDYKRIIGKKLMPLCHQRLALQTGQIIFQSEQAEMKFFTMLSVLIKRCKENIYLARGDMKDRMFKYMSMIARDQRVKAKI
jgi:hypothetical protein